MNRLALAGLVLLAGATLAQAQVVLRVGDQKGNAQAVMQAAGVLKDVAYRIDWKEFPAAAPLLEALAAGAVDTGLVGDAPFTFAAASGAAVKAIAAIRQNPEGLAVLVPSSSGIRDVADLKGKTIATGRGSIGHQLVLAAIAANGWWPSDVKLVFLAPADAKIAYAHGSVDAWSTWEPYVSQEEVLFEARPVVTGEKLTPGLSFVVATPDAIRDKREALDDFLRRLAAARTWSQGHLAAYAASWGSLMGVPESVAEHWLARADIRLAPIDDGVLADEQSTIALYTRAGLITRPLAAADIVDASFAAALPPSASR